MNIKRLLCCLALLLAAPIVLADAPAASSAVQRDATTFTEAQVSEITSSDVLNRMLTGYKRLGDQKRFGWTLARLSTLHPDSGDLRMMLAVHYAEQGDKSKTYDLLLKMKDQGYGADLKDDPRFDKVTGTEAWDYVVQNLQMNLQPFGEGKVAFKLPKEDALFESIVWDPKREKFLVGSVRDGQIRIADKNGKLTEFIAPADGSGLWSVFSMAVDSARDLLYVSSSSTLYFKGFRPEDLNQTGLFTFRLSTGKLLNKVVMPTNEGNHTLSSIAVSKDGKVFVADGLRNEIYTLEGDSLKLVVANPKLTSIRGMAVSDDGNTLYFADYALGIFGADLKSGTGFPLAHDTTQLVLGGIEGLYWYDGTLVAIENGMSPHRIIRLNLSKDGKSVTKMMPIDVANPAFGVPTFGTIAGNDLYFIANSQRNLYGKYGDLKDKDTLEAVRIFRSNLRFAWNEKGITGGGSVPVRQATPDEGRKMLEQEPSLQPHSETPVPAEKKNN